ncbi:MAG: septum formation inhibitor Maf [Flavobacteriaceae bacterium CG2_30_34_30]|nr:MAG: septum formation inhibitor Maf [Flavobacteriaceae bacterium CG2_30_34_30]PIV50324.1 MAG: septum formation inhibitor Maf [Flavobacteriaceae bacterium CG02_land_8_20_14_3_00_34_13]
MRILHILLLLSAIFFVQSCTKSEEKNTISNTEREISEDFKSYWFSGTAEITSYTLEQERYGEMRDGSAVLIYVTEDFHGDTQVKANKKNDLTIPVLKLNSTKNFLTGIYPYSIMTSTFIPIFEETHALKISTSIQEWCGQTYAQLNNRNAFEITSHSYFDNEADQNFILEKTWLEEEFWTLLRIDPTALPVGEISVIPSLEYAKLRHKNLKAELANATLTEEESLINYTISYPKSDRSLSIWFQKEAPYVIEKWEEKIGKFTTKATKRNQIQSAYWSKNKRNDEVLRESLFE